MPTYHSQITSVVRTYANEVANADTLSLKDLENFLKGLRSHTPRIAVLDAYVQLTKPEARKRFFVSTYIDNIGSVVGDYLEAPAMDGYERSVVIERITGAYQLKLADARHENSARQAPRYFVIRRSNSAAYLLCYEFSSWLPASIHPERDEQFKLVTGICIPQPRRCFVMMRDFRYHQRKFGALISPPKAELPSWKREEPDVIEIYNFASNDNDSWSNHTNRASPYRTKEDMEIESALGTKIIDKIILSKIEKLVDSFGDVL